MKLDIGSGGRSQLGGDWIGVDMYAADADKHWDMRILPLPGESVEQIYSCHALEHVSRHNVIQILNEWWRVLKWDCTINVLVPDLQEALNGMLDACNRKELPFFEWRCHFLFGKQDHPGNFHLCGFTDWLLDYYFSMANFKVVKRNSLVIHDIKTLSWVGAKIK